MSYLYELARITMNMILDIRHTNNLNIVPIIYNGRTIFLEAYLDILNRSNKESIVNELNNSASTRVPTVSFFHMEAEGQKNFKKQEDSFNINRMGLSTLLIDLLTYEENEMDMSAKN